jgi:hypothetical protein
MRLFHIQYILKIIILLYFFIFTFSLIIFAIYGLLFGDVDDKANFWSIITNIVGYNFGIVTSLTTNKNNNILKSTVKKISYKVKRRRK